MIVNPLRQMAQALRPRGPRLCPAGPAEPPPCGPTRGDQKGSVIGNFRGLAQHVDAAAHRRQRIQRGRDGGGLVGADLDPVMGIRADAGAGRVIAPAADQQDIGEGIGAQGGLDPGIGGGAGESRPVCASRS